MKRLIVLGVIGMIMGVGAFGYGVYGIFAQHNLIQSARPVDAVIKSVRIEEWRQSAFRTYTPKVSFYYTIDGQQRQSDKLMPDDEDRGEAWARGILERYPPETECTAYVDPNDVNNAFLLREYSSMPYTACLAGVLFFFAGIVILREQGRFRSGPRLPEPVGDGWYQLISRWTVRDAVRLFLPLGLAWQALGTPVWAHYLSVTAPPRNTLFMIYVYIYVGVGLILIVIGGWAYLCMRAYDDPVILLNQETPQLGGNLAVRVEQLIRRAGTLKAVSVQIICQQVDRVTINLAPQDTSKKLWQLKQAALEGYEAQAGETVVADFTFHLPSVDTPATTSDRRAKRRFRWMLKMRSRMRGQLPYPDDFEIVVTPAPAYQPPVAD